MKQYSTLSILLLSLFCLTPGLLSAQMIWPGDVNNNGIVNGVDWLYWGVGFQSNGPTRPDANTEWEAQPMGNAWAEDFPGSMNYAYADANGDGLINMDDASVIRNNFRLNHGTASADPYQPNSIANSAPPLTFHQEEILAVPNGEAALVATIGDDDSSFDAVYGLTFVLEYPANAITEDGLLFASEGEGLFSQDGALPVTFIENDPNAGRAEITIVRTNQTDVAGFGQLGKFVINFSDLQSEGLPDTLWFEVTDIMAIDVNMNAKSIQPGTMYYINTNSNDGVVSGPCPSIVDPVCGSNGVTYLNSCYAEAAGVYDYTSGTCFADDCIDPYQIDSDAVCTLIYDPVCGCNGITYPNECVADAAGVLSTTPGPCGTNSCYDPQYVMTSSSTTMDVNSGVITVDCPAIYDPVCGCNGVTYANACIAEASGITMYTQGSCNDGCVDPGQMNWDAVCTAVYDPVCGCNGVTYPNPCEANAAGVATYYSGPCGGTSSWCAEAVPVHCGDFLAYETTVGAGNNILQYPGCSSQNFQGPDRVYVLNKTSVGDLQIGLEILTPNMDLDLFLLADNCSQLTCLRSSTTSNNATNNEGIVYEDAPIGTYYIVIDGQYANSAGAFRLEVSCGYLYCGDAVSLECGVPYYGNNVDGSDDVSLYGCDGNVLNVENNGPEKVHTFTVTEAGPVEISLSGLNANLELFLLRSCDRGDCIEYSQHPGTNSEYISEYLQPGTYYIVVDGYNGAVSPYTLEVDCSDACDFHLGQLTSTSSGCGQSSGSITISTYGGSPNYHISYYGPVSGSFATGANSCTIYNLPPGTYTVTKTDYYGCSVTGTVTILGGSNLSANMVPHDAVCMDHGYIEVWINNGNGPYTVYVNGPTSGTFTVNYNEFNITNLAAGDYTIHITDASGCSVSQYVTIEHSSGNFTWNYTVSPANCGAYGAIHIDTYNGDAPYNVWVNGPVTGGATVYASSFNVINLPGGVYEVTVEDENWCAVTQTVVVPDQNLSIDLTANNGICGEYGSISVHIGNGWPPYHISWSGPVSGSAYSNNEYYDIPNLPSGSYTVTVTDDAGCTDHGTISIYNGEQGGLNTQVIPLDGDCGQNGAIWIDIYNGTPGYTIEWIGPVSGWLTTDNNGLDIPNLPCGTYTVIITDYSGCSSTHTVYINCNGDLDVSLNPEAGICGQPGSIWVSINGGSPPYSVSWTGPANGNTTTNTNGVNIPNLPAGTYNVSVTDYNGCTDYAVTTVSSSEGNLYLQTSVTEANCAEGGAILLTISGGTGPYEVFWTGPESGNTTSNNNVVNLPDLTSGNYSIYVSDNNGCSETTYVSISNVGSNLDVSLVGNDAICGQYGNIGVYISNGSAPYLISWTGPISGSATSFSNVYQIPNTPPGTYNVVVTDANGCSNSSSVTVNSTNELEAIVTVYNGDCGNTGSIQVDVTQGTPYYTISWTGPVNGSVNTADNWYTIPNLPSGTYTIVVTDANGCTLTFVRTVNNSDGDLQINVALIYNICGQYNTLWVDIIGGTGPYTVTWTGTQNGSATTYTNGYEIMDLPPGTYKVTVVDANGCMVMEQGIIIYPSPVDLFSAVPYNGICGETGSIQLNITGGTPNYVVSWNGPVSGTQTYTMGGVHVLDNLPGGTYVITLTDANGCTETETVVIDNSGGEVEIITALIYNECGQYNTIWVDIIGGTPPYTVTWTGTENGSATTYTDGYEIMDLPPGTYKVTVVDANGCMDMEQGIIIYPAPIDLFTAVPYNGICEGPGSIQVSIIGGTPDYTLSWSGPQNGSVVLAGGVYNIPNLPSGTYTLVLIDSNGCAETEVVTITNSEGDVNLVAYGNTGTCLQTASITVQAQGGTPNYTLSWTGPESGSTVIGNTPFTIPDLAPGMYTLTATDVNGCDDQTTVQVSMLEDDLSVYVNPLPGICGSYGRLAVQINGGSPNYTVSWIGPSNGSTNTGAQYLEIPNLPNGSYTVTVTDANGCTTSATTTLYSSPNELAIWAEPFNGDCGQYGYIDVNVTDGTGPYQITWTGPVSGSVTNNSNLYTIPNLPSGSYTVSVTDANGCSDVVIATVTNTENDLYVNATPYNGDCGQYGSIVVNVSGGESEVTISWTGPVSGSTTVGGSSYTIPNLPSGSYTITATSGDCSDSTTVYVSNTEDDLAVYATPYSGDCGQYGSILVNVTGGESQVTISWNGPVNGSVTINGSSYTIQNLPSGNYTITANSGNCSDSTIAYVNNTEDDLAVYATPYNGDCGANGHIVVSISGGVTPYSLSWSGPVSGSQTVNGNTYTISNLPSGTYVISVVSGSCDDATTVVLDNNQGNVYVNAVPNDAPCDALATIDVWINGGTAPYYLVWSGPVAGSATVNGSYYQIQDLPGGSYIITVEDINGCSNGTTTSVEQGDFDVTFTGNDGDCGDNATIQVSMQNGTPPYTIAWEGDVWGEVVTYESVYEIICLPGDTYHVTVTDANGCVEWEDVTVESGPTDFEVIHTVGNNGCGAFSNIWMDFYGGVGPYTIIWSGPTSGTHTTDNPWWDITEVPSGIYIVKVIDGSGCVDVQIVIVSNTIDDLNVDFYPVDGSCGDLGTIGIYISGGAPQYTIAWYSGNTPLGEWNTIQNNYTITNLASGSYYVRVTDENGCEEAATVYIDNSPNGLGLDITTVPTGCYTTGTIGILMQGGQAPYSVSWNGPDNGSATANAPNYMITGLSAGTYNVQVVDANGCTGYAIVHLPGGPWGSLDAYYTVETDGLTAYFINQSSSGNYSWSFGDGTSSNAANPVHNYAQSGTYDVCLTVSGPCGSDTYCTTVAVVTDGSYALLDVGNGSGGPGSTAQVPVYVHNLNNLISLAGSFVVEDEEVGVVTGVTPGLIAPQFNAGNLTFSYYNNSGETVNLGSNTPLFYLNVELLGSIGEETDIEFTVSPLPIEVGSMVDFVPTVVPYTLSPGTVSISNMGSVAGGIETYWGDGIMEAAVSIVGPNMDETMMTTETGQYTVPELELGNEYTISVAKDTEPENGLSTYALFIGQRFLLGMEPPQIVSPYQVVAGDANCNDAFTTLDLFLIQRLIIGADEAFANCPSWVFVSGDSEMPEDFDAYNVFPYANTNTMMVMQNETADFVGVKVGDILGESNPDMFGGGDDRNNEQLEFQAPNAEVSAGEEVTLYFRSPNFADVVSYQFGMLFDPSKVEFIEFEEAGAAPFNTVVAGTNNAEAGALRLSWFSLDGEGHTAESSQVLYGIRFRALEDITDWTPILRLNPEEMLPEAYTSAEQPLDPVISFNTTVDTDDVLGSVFELYQNTPNPYKGETIISFHLPEAGQASLVIRDALGKEVVTINGDYGAGFQTVLVDRPLAAGVYHYTLTAGLQTATRSMIVID